MQVNSVQQVLNTRQPVLRIFNRHPAHDAVNLVAFFQEQFREIAAILPRYPGNERAFWTRFDRSHIAIIGLQNMIAAECWAQSFSVWHGDNSSWLRARLVAL